ncbi:DUF1697 domain-containing protein [Colwellia echini]|uniref:DUF1697 domain-containing protein n=1 Tax=Colwellia echini TaxID=1982103 RepID=A0ABY3MSQ1_9GAMM|nr:DUF1697 domain-containing protein [Colwellia echini]TYK64223.1 DUF1697 domain-containing protein [Colwellia echini]
MKNYILLFRGINVGGKNLLPMKELVPLLTKYNFQGVSSYIQSGNVVLKCTSQPDALVRSIVLDNFGFTVKLFSLEQAEFTAIQEANPYKIFEGKFVHCYFCNDNIELNQAKVDKYLASSESYTVIGKVFYLHAPEGIGRSKLVANIEVCLSQPATGRNLNTINKISTMLTKLA